MLLADTVTVANEGVAKGSDDRFALQKPTEPGTLVTVTVSAKDTAGIAFLSTSSVFC